MRPPMGDLDAVYKYLRKVLEGAGLPPLYALYCSINARPMMNKTAWDSVASDPKPPTTTTIQLWTRT